MRFFYLPGIAGSKVHLPEDESRHCIRVLRLGKGDQVRIVDGKGNLYTGIITDPGLPRCSVEILQVDREYGRRDHYLHIAIAPTKSTDRFEWFLEKSVEIGIDEITPVVCERSERKYIRTDRAEKIIISAIKQSGRAYLPVLNPVAELQPFISAAGTGRKFICHCGSDNLPFLADIIEDQSDALVLVGPEGDFTRDEIIRAVNKGFVEAGLGPFTYRTETAGIQVCSIFQFTHRK